jgi:UDP-2,3-diacylglucosamine hydrolase
VTASRCLVLADAHLGQVSPSVETALHRFLATVPRPGDELLVNGDLFDFWFEYASVIPRRHFATVAKLHDLVARGIPVTFVGGNHDRWGGDFLRHDLGIAFHAGAAELELAGRRAFVAHGDGYTEQHWSGALTHRLLRHPATVAVFRMLHPTIGFWIARKLSGALADSTKNKAVLDRAEADQAAYARGLLTRRPELALVVLAHTHRPRLERLPDGRAYLNPGAFLNEGRYAVVTRDDIELCQFVP